MTPARTAARPTATLLRLVPALDALRNYRVGDARADLIAGLTVASIAVPQAMAYALVAGVPVEYGLYTAIVMTVIVTLALMIGTIQLGITLLRLGDLTRYVSHSVIVGFTLGAGSLLVFDQVKNLLGLRAMGDAHDHVLYRFWLSVTAGTGCTRRRRRSASAPWC